MARFVWMLLFGAAKSGCKATSREVSIAAFNSAESSSSPKLVFSAKRHTVVAKIVVFSLGCHGRGTGSGAGFDNLMK